MINKIIFKTVIMLGIILSFSACKRDFNAPPLTAPVYNGPGVNTTIAQLKAKYATVKTPEKVDQDLILRAYVVGNDESGNIYKQIFVQDETGGISIGLEQNSVYTTHRVGQQVYINLRGLFMVKYGDELQIGYGDTNANRLPWAVATAHIFLNGWPEAVNVIPTVVDLSKLTPNMVNTLVEIRNVQFVNGGKKPFTTGDNTTNEAIKDANGTGLDVRTSNFSTFAKDMLPTGKGTLVGVLGRYNGGWQFFLRTKNDIKNFDGNNGGTPEVPGLETFFSETFGGGTYTSGNRPKINDFTDFDKKAPVKYSEPTGAADIRSMSGGNGAHIWLPANRDATVKVEGINTTGKTDISLSFQLAANLFNATDEMNLNVFSVKINGVTKTLPSTPVSKTAGDDGKFYNFTFDGVPAMDNLVLEFISTGETNKLGLRLDNIKLTSGKGTSGPIIVGQ